ncbi:hypothetical protein [uncultured Selenomonas sp.]|uniref:hypothetical protein n=1 Tax=uncultured Selenomonas sp. TaxID=159275 RepID=UPI0026762A63|nr:hypothetical protein [uncultured Selenomonas sp.]
MRRIAVCGFWTVLFVLFAGLGSGEAAEDMRFVDANGDTGYYVDAASITRLSDVEREAGVAVVKATENRRLLYRIRFNRQMRTYQILSGQVGVYDTKEVLRTTPGMAAPQAYTPTSPMQSIEDFIEELLAKQKTTP